MGQPIEAAMKARSNYPRQRLSRSSVPAGRFSHATQDLAYRVVPPPQGRQRRRKPVRKRSRRSRSPPRSGDGELLKKNVRRCRRETGSARTRAGATQARSKNRRHDFSGCAGGSRRLCVAKVAFARHFRPHDGRHRLRCKCKHGDSEANRVRLLIAKPSAANRGQGADQRYRDRHERIGCGPPTLQEPPTAPREQRESSLVILLISSLDGMGDELVGL